jgi:peptidoglycan/LPS O-acetylase OafA/YrhL
MSQTAGSGSPRLQSIDLLRGIAALAVVILHVPHQAPGWEKQFDLAYWLWLPINLGHLGVSLFVVLSGFCIHTNTLRASRPGELSLHWGAFWKRRFIRLYPPYALAVLLSAGLTYLLFRQQGVPIGEALRGIRIDLLLHLAMIHNLMPTYASGLYNGPLWTLGMEEQLYALYLLLLLVRRWSLRGMLLMTLGVSTLLWQAWQIWGPTTLGSGRMHLGGWTWWPFQFWLLWTLGTVAAEAHAGRIRLPAWCCRGGVGLLLLLAGLLQYKLVWPALTSQANAGASLAWLCGSSGMMVEVASWLGQATAYFTLHLSFFVLVNACNRREQLQGPSQNPVVRFLAWVGLFSYSLYLLHVPLIEASKHWWPVENVLLRYLLLVPLCLAVAWLFFHLVEKHFLYRKARPAQVKIAAVEQTRQAA